jgi:hypothetical protein
VSVADVSACVARVYPSPAATRRVSLPGEFAVAHRFTQQVNQYIRAKAELFAPLTAHTTINGTGRENVLREFVHDLIPRRYEALTGTIAPAPESTASNSQVDLMVVNTTDFPVLVRDSSLAVVLPHSVEVTVEIKTDLDAQKLLEALRQIRRIHQLFPSKKPPLSILFSYGYPASPKTLASNLETALGTEPWKFSELPEIIVASGDQHACIARMYFPSLDTAEFQIFETKSENTITYLLGKILAQLNPKRQVHDSSGSDVGTGAWSWITEYFDVELGTPSAMVQVQEPPNTRG